MHICRLRAFLTLGNLIFHGLAVIQRPKSFCGNIGMVNEQIIPTIVGNDKTEPFSVVKPLYFTFIQFIVSLRLPNRPKPAM